MTTSPRYAAARSPRPDTRLGLLLVLPAMTAVLLLYALPLMRSLASAFQGDDGLTLDHLVRAFTLYGRDVAFSVGVSLGALVIIAGASIAIAGYLTLGTTPWAVRTLRWLYRWPLFIPFVVAGQLSRSFLSTNGMMNTVLIESGLMSAHAAQSFLDWRGLMLTFAWKQIPFVTLLLAGAMASIEQSHSEAARNLGAGRLRCLFDIVLPQAAPTLWVGLILSLVAMLSVL